MSNAKMKTIFQQVLAVNQDRAGHFENQATIEVSEENPLDLTIILQPIYGSFAGAEVRFKLVLPQEFPDKPPSCSCLTKIFHPNVSFSGSVCFNLFNTEFQAGMPISTFVVGLLWFLSNPNPDSALNSSCVIRDQVKYEEAVAQAVMGLAVNGVNFEPHMNRTNTSPLLLARLGSLSLAALLRAAGLQGTINVKTLAEKGLTEVLQSSTLGGLLDAKPAFAELVPVSVTGNTVRHRTKVLGKALQKDIDTRQVVKEVLLLVKEKPVLVLTSGLNRIDLPALAEFLEVSAEDVQFPFRDIAASHYNMNQFSFLDQKTWPKDCRVVLNEQLSLQDVVYLPSGVKGYFLAVDPATLFRRYPAETVQSGYLATVEPCPDDGLRTGAEKRAAFYFGADLLQGVVERHILSV